MASNLTPEVANLFNQVSRWAEQEGWAIAPMITSEELPNSLYGEFFERHGIIIQTPKEERIYLEPSGRTKDGTDVVDIFAWPTLVRVRLLHPQNNPGWIMVTDSGIPFHHDWNKENFIRLARDLVAA